MPSKQSNNFFKEEYPYSVKDFAGKLQIAIGEASSLVKRLMLAGLVKHYQEDRPEDWRDEALHGEYIIEDVGVQSRFKFVYVGIIEIDGRVLKCCPKYIKDNREPTLQDMRLVLTAIERYNSQHTSLDTSIADNAVKMPNQLALALHILREYVMYGLYSNQREELMLHGNGEIDWEVTINTAMPLIRENRPYYFDYYTNEMRQDETDYISRLHACIVTECSNKLKTSELAAILDLEPPMPYVGERIDFGSDEYISQRLRQELNVQFISQKQSLLRSLLAWVEKDRLATESSGIRLFGTNSFHTLWENMCAEVFQSQYRSPVSALGVTLRDDFVNSSETLESLIKKPQWQAVQATKPIDADQTLRPDFVSVVKVPNHGHCFVILDAKYYDIQLTEKSVKGQPGVEDVSKQYLYLLAYSHFTHVHGMSRIHAFVTPTDETKSYVAGIATMPIFTDMPAIQVVKLSATRVLEKYNNHAHLFLTDEVSALFTRE